MLVGYDWRMLRYMAGTTWRDGTCSEEVPRCRPKEFRTVLRVRRLRWFGYVKKRKDVEAVE